jgi:3-phosphoglycerate kinase
VMIKFLSRTNLKNYRGKICLLRIDLNVEPGEEKNAFRVEASLPTIKFLLKHKIKIVLLSHRGRPKIKNQELGIRNHELSLKPFASIISKKLKQPVVFFSNFNFQKIKKEIGNSRKRIFLLENLRFLPGEEKNDKKLAKQLASLGDFYVNDAFAVSHRENASVVAVTNFLPSYGGLLLEKEIENLSRTMDNFKRPLVVIVGGAKVSDKIGVIKYFWSASWRILLGGGPANTFFAAAGVDIGNSIFDKESFPFVRKVINSPKIILPIDVRREGGKILDIGFVTMRKYAEIIKNAKTIIWNGPMGLFEKKKFEDGTRSIWQALLKNRRAMIVVGGGETTASLQLITHNLQLITKNKNLFLSTGGGAMLEYLSGKKLPGIEALRK